MTKITLCMIVRDEEKLLAGCLLSARNAVDEVIVVDTGSTDGTKAIARESGARVIDFVWCEDFAAARNVGLRDARGEWILVLDADERLAPGSAKKLRAAVVHADFDLGLLRLHNASRIDARFEDVVSGKERQHEVQLIPRLMRRTPDLAFVGAIHEAPVWSQRRRREPARLDVDIVHLGATQEIVLAKGKLQRNIRLLEVRVARDASDVVASGHLAHEYLRAGERDKAHAVAERGWPYARQAAASGVSIHYLATARTHLLVLNRKFQDAIETAELARQLAGDSPDLLFLMGHALESEALETSDALLKANLLRRARDAYAACVGMRDTVFDHVFVIGARTWSGWMRLGTTELLLGHALEARRAFEAVLEIRPGDKLALLGCAEADIALGELHRALAAIEPLLDETPDGWTLAATAARAAGQIVEARLFATRAVALMANGFSAPHRKPVLGAVVAALSQVASV